MVRWLGLPAEVFLRGPAGQSPDLMTQIAALLHARRDLSPEAAALLEETIREAYLCLRTTGS
jgi:hypothetical protein